MSGTVTKRPVPVQALHQASLTEEQARERYQQGEEAVVFALLELTKQLAEARSPSVICESPTDTPRKTR